MEYGREGAEGGAGDASQGDEGTSLEGDGDEEARLLMLKEDEASRGKAREGKGREGRQAYVGKERGCADGRRRETA